MQCRTLPRSSPTHLCWNDFYRAHARIVRVSFMNTISQVTEPCAGPREVDEYHSQAALNVSNMGLQYFLINSLFSETRAVPAILAQLVEEWSSKETLTWSSFFISSLSCNHKIKHHLLWVPLTNLPDTLFARNTKCKLFELSSSMHVHVLAVPFLRQWHRYLLELAGVIARECNWPLLDLVVIIAVLQLCMISFRPGRSLV